jgi:hypothetical protein
LVNVLMLFTNHSFQRFFESICGKYSRFSWLESSLECF